MEVASVSVLCCPDHGYPACLPVLSCWTVQEQRRPVGGADCHLGQLLPPRLATSRGKQCSAAVAASSAIVLTSRSAAVYCVVAAAGQAALLQQPAGGLELLLLPLLTGYILSTAGQGATCWQATAITKGSD